MRSVKDPKSFGEMIIMLRRIKHPSGPLAVLAALFLILAIVPGCASTKKRARINPAPGAHISSLSFSTDLARYQKIAVLNLHEGEVKGGEDVCSATGLLINSGKISAGSGETVAGYLDMHMRKAGFPLMERGEAVKAQISAASQAPEAYGLELALDVADKTNADALVMGCVMKFEELEGTKYGSDNPASAAFMVAVVDPAIKRVVWAGKFEKKQAPLFSNLLEYRVFFSGGMVWMSPDKLSGVGAGFLVEAMKEKPLEQR